MRPMHIGPFVLEQRVGRGAHASVWRAHHAKSAVRVAVKVLDGEGATDAGARRRFAREVRAVAGLDHAAIIRVHDFGALDALAADPAHGLIDGAPYLVMDWHGGGTLDRRRGKVPFAEIRATLLTALDALAHAHARGVVHRDIKPANLLLGDAGPVLADFGVVLPVDERSGEDDEVVWGTPNYMAPEQVRNDRRALGPWTDLYALGCTTWALATGRAPYAGQGPLAAMHGHLRGALPPFTPRSPMPPGFIDWLRRLLAVDPHARFRWAADAAVELMALPDVDAADEDVTLADGMLGLDDDRTVRAPPVFVALDETAWAERGRTGALPPLPADWRRPDPPWSAHLTDCGQSLVDLRTIRIRGRQAERDLLWRRLRSVAAGDGPAMVVLRGPPGIGRTRLVSWLCHRAHELGQADVLRLGVDAVGDAHPAAAGILRTLGADGLDAAEAAMRAERHPAIEPELAARIGALAAADRSIVFDGERITVASAGEVLNTLVDAVAALSADRPLVVAVEGLAQRGAARELGLLATRLLDHQPAVPVLLLTTAGPDRPLTARRLMAHPAVDVLDLEPLGAEHQAEALRARLPLDPATLDRLVRSSGGNPLFADELLCHWLHVGAVESGPDGFRLDPEHAARVPGSITAVWLARVDAVLAGITPDPRPALELAAVPGLEIDQAELARACAQAGLDPPAIARDRLLDAGLIVEAAPDRFTLGHALLRDALVERAQRRGRLAKWHRTWAAVLASPSRRAAHLMAAGDAAAAMPLWIEAAETVHGLGDMAGAGPFLLEAARAGRAMGLRLDDPRWIGLRSRWASYLTYALRRGGMRHAARALAAAERIGDQVLQARAVRQFARGLTAVGRFTEAAEALKRAESLARALDDPFLMAVTRDLQCVTALLGGELERARALADSAHDGFAALGDRIRQAGALNQIGEIERRLARPGAARAAYVRALELLTDVDVVWKAVVAGNLAALDLAAGDVAQAARRARWARRRARRAGHVAYGTFANALLLACAGHAGDARHWDAAWRGLGAAVDLAYVEQDIARSLEQAATWARTRLPARARAAGDVAVRQYRALGLVDRADALDADLSPEPG